jgi:hexosaminidase
MNKKQIIYLLASLFLMQTYSCRKVTETAPLSIVWEMGKNGIEPGFYENTFYLVNQSKKPLPGGWTVYYCQMPAAVKPDANLPVVIEQISSTYYKMYPSPAYQAIAAGDTLAITFRCEGSILKNIGAPEGAYYVMPDKNGKETPMDVTIIARPFVHNYQWSRPESRELPYPNGNQVYEQNAVFSEKVSLKPTDIFPSLKSVKETGGTFPFTKDVCLKYDEAFADEANLLKEKLQQLYGCKTGNTAAPVTIELKKIENPVPNDEYYQMELSNGNIEISGNTPHGIFNGTQSLLGFIHSDKLPYDLPNAVISDYPDLLYRGQMLDVARNFSSKENVMKLIDVLSSYKINTLHLHLSDDEGWRLEIPGLEELTSIAARRGHTRDERECLYPAYGSGWNANNKASTGNGFYSRADFIEILKYAQARHIRVIPEIDLPGHSRAAITAMNVRYHKYIHSDKAKAEEYLLIDFADTSRYLSAQSYTDNVINVAMPSVYRFIKKVTDEIAAVYKDAGVRLEILHLGGDEVAHGAWTGSEIVQTLMKEKGLKEIHQLKSCFIEQVLAILNEKNIQLGAWQEAGLLPDETANPKFAQNNVLSYCWNTVPEWKGDEIPYRLANANYPVILCNVTNFYFDLSCNKHPDEPGLYWGGFVNEYNSFNATPFDVYKSVRNDMAGNPIDIVKASKEKLALSSGAVQNIKGVQSQIWAETIRNFEMVEYYLFPKIFGLTERGWNACPDWVNEPYGEKYTTALRLYNAKISMYELPRLAKRHITFRVAQPGIKIIDGKLYANSPIFGSEIRYTTDGSEPNEQSALWTQPVECKAARIKAKVFYCGRKSVTTDSNYTLHGLILCNIIAKAKPEAIQ